MHPREVAGAELAPGGVCQLWLHQDVTFLERTGVSSRAPPRYLPGSLPTQHYGVTCGKVGLAQHTSVCVLTTLAAQYSDLSA